MEGSGVRGIIIPEVVGSGERTGVQGVSIVRLVVSSRGTVVGLSMT